MTYDIIIRGGTIVDGSGAPRFRADLAIQDGRIASIGRIPDASREEIDADGLVVAPGFIDGHTHFDAQISWDPYGTSSSYHGVTSVIMGNCGFTLAPCHPDDQDLLMRTLEAVEDIPADAQRAGVAWTWQTFPEYLDFLEQTPKGLNYGGYVGHTALRTYVMRERAFTEASSEADRAEMKRILREAVQAGAMGFSTTRSPAHKTSEGDPVPSRLADWNEVRELVMELGALNRGMVEISGEPTMGQDPNDPNHYENRLRDLAVDSGRPIFFPALSSRRAAPDGWKRWFDNAAEAASRGARMFGQAHSRQLATNWSYRTEMPFDRLSVWRDLRKRPLDEQLAAFRDPDTRARLVHIANTEDEDFTKVMPAQARKPSDWDWVFILDHVDGTPNRSLGELAREREEDPVETMLQIGIEQDLDTIYMVPLANEYQDQVLEIMREPRSLVTFSDGGAHVSQIMDCSLQTHVLTHWVRNTGELTLEEGVKLLTWDMAAAWELPERGLLRRGYKADIIIFNPDTVAPQRPEVVHDLPAQQRRLLQKATGYHYSIVNGGITMRDGEPTGVTTGEVLHSV